MPFFRRREPLFAPEGRSGAGSGRRVQKQDVELLNIQREVHKKHGPIFIIEIEIHGEPTRYLVREDRQGMQFHKITRTGNPKDKPDLVVKSALTKVLNGIIPKMRELPNPNVLEYYQQNSKIAGTEKVRRMGTHPLIETPIGNFVVSPTNVWRKISRKTIKFEPANEDEGKIARYLLEKLK